MFNPWGALFILIGLALIFVGYKGSQNSVYAFLTGNVPGSNQPGTTSGTVQPTPAVQPTFGAGILSLDSFLQQIKDAANTLATTVTTPKPAATPTPAATSSGAPAIGFVP